MLYFQPADVRREYTVHKFNQISMASNLFKAASVRTTNSTVEREGGDGGQAHTFTACAQRDWAGLECIPLLSDPSGQN